MICRNVRREAPRQRGSDGGAHGNASYPAIELLRKSKAFHYEAYG